MDIIRKYGKKIQEDLSFYSTPIMSENKKIIGSGVYCTYNNNYYVLTAGHVIKEICGKNAYIFSPINGADDCTVNTLHFLKRYHFDINNELDFGLIEIPLTIKGEIEASKKVFYNFNRTDYTSLIGNESLIIGGFPEFLLEKSKINFFSIYFEKSKEDATVYESRSKRLFNIPLDRSKLYSLEDQKEITFTEELNGMSGCGIWKVSKENDIKVELIAIYCGSTKNVKVTDLYGSWINFDEELIRNLKPCC